MWTMSARDGQGKSQAAPPRLQLRRPLRWAPAAEVGVDRAEPCEEKRQVPSRTLRWSHHRLLSSARTPRWTALAARTPRAGCRRPWPQLRRWTPHGRRRPGTHRSRGTLHQRRSRCEIPRQAARSVVGAMTTSPRTPGPAARRATTRLLVRRRAWTDQVGWPPPSQRAIGAAGRTSRTRSVFDSPRPQDSRADRPLAPPARFSPP